MSFRSFRHSSSSGLDSIVDLKKLDIEIHPDVKNFEKEIENIEFIITNKMYCGF